MGPRKKWEAVQLFSGPLHFSKKKNVANKNDELHKNAKIFGQIRFKNKFGMLLTNIAAGWLPCWQGSDQCFFVTLLPQFSFFFPNVSTWKFYINLTWLCQKWVPRRQTVCSNSKPKATHGVSRGTPRRKVAKVSPRTSSGAAYQKPTHPSRTHYWHVEYAKNALGL